MERSTMFVDWKLNIVKIAILSKLKYRVSMIPILKS